MELWCSSGVEYSASRTKADAASSASRSPFSVAPGPPGPGPVDASGRSPGNVTSCASSSYRTTRDSAASLACSDVSATTSATGQPACGTLSCWKTAIVGSGGIPSMPV